MTSKSIPKSMKNQCEFHARKSDAKKRENHEQWSPKESKKREIHEKIDVEKRRIFGGCARFSPGSHLAQKDYLNQQDT